ncbi:hypothetical protein [Clostridium sp. MD294]|uniref:hypothetical protein n=1 Tax=Clostridium sp. MD294 TaxID=97138 RepID=UPI0002C8B477|nr:hypothetical protein [Clostridium sp. MD294]NDO46456.1 hypothetical protein [Clostridium sp. MD294]USF29114.1 hypothetical protein C820_000497 [Clostridium sp. MD294]
MIRFKKIIVICCILLCGVFLISFLTKQRFYIHNKNIPIQEIKISKIFSVPSMEIEDSVETAILQDKKEIESMISKLKNYTFQKRISLDKIMGIPTTTEDITTFFIDIYYDTNEQQQHFDRIQFSATEDVRVRNVKVHCYNANSKKKYQGTVSNEIMKQFLEYIEIYF